MKVRSEDYRGDWKGSGWRCPRFHKCLTQRDGDDDEASC